MADLDDFFAKKDKKKGKAKKFGTAEEIAKQLDDTSKKVVESKMKLRPVDSDGKHDPNEVSEWPVAIGGRCLPVCGNRTVLML